MRPYLLLEHDINGGINLLSGRRFVALNFAKRNPLHMTLLVIPMVMTVIIGTALILFSLSESQRLSQEYSYMVKMYPDGDVIENLVEEIELPRKEICPQDNKFTQYYYDTKNDQLFCEHTWTSPATDDSMLLIGLAVLGIGMIGGIAAICVYWKVNPDMRIPLSALSLMEEGRLRWTVEGGELYCVTSIEPMQEGDARETVRTHNVQTAEILKITEIRRVTMLGTAIMLKCTVENQCFDIKNSSRVTLFLSKEDFEFPTVAAQLKIA